MLQAYKKEVVDKFNFVHVDMTSSVPWEPYDEDSTRIEENLRRQFQGDHAMHNVSAVRSSPYTSSCPSALPIALGDRVGATVSGIKSDGKSYLIQADQLARRWRISLECARRTDIWADVKKGPCKSVEGNLYVASLLNVCLKEICCKGKWREVL